MGTRRESSEGRLGRSGTARPVPDVSGCGAVPDPRSAERAQGGPDGVPGRPSLASGARPHTRRCRAGRTRDVLIEDVWNGRPPPQPPRHCTSTCRSCAAPSAPGPRELPDPPPPRRPTWAGRAGGRTHPGGTRARQGHSRLVSCSRTADIPGDVESRSTRGVESAAPPGSHPIPTGWRDTFPSRD